MLVDPGHHLGDAWFHVAADGTAHCSYLRCSTAVPRHTAWEVAHATSRDLRHWTLHGTVLPARADGRCVATGSVLAAEPGDDDRAHHLVAWTVGWDQSEPVVAIAEVADLGSPWPADLTLVPVPPTGYRRDDPHLDPISGPRPVTHWRDPFLTTDPDGTPVVLVCAGRTDRPADASGTIGVIRRCDRGWDVAPPLDVEPVARELECPQVRQVDGAWFLVFSAWSTLLAPAVRRRLPPGVRGGTWAMVGPGPEGPFRLASPRPIVVRSDLAPGSRVPYAGQIVTLDGRAHLLGTIWDDDGLDAISDPIPIERRGDTLVASVPATW